MRSYYRNEALAAEIYEAAEDPYRPSIRKRMLQPELPQASYPNSPLYSPESRPSALRTGTRAPVLQYAHPELGVQPAKIVKSERRRTDDNLSVQVTTEVAKQQQQQQYQYGEHRQKKKYVLNDKNMLDSYPYKGYHPSHFYGLKRPPPPEAPFWVKISDNLKSHFSDGVAKVSDRDFELWVLDTWCGRGSLVYVSCRFSIESGLN